MIFLFDVIADWSTFLFIYWRIFHSRISYAQVFNFILWNSSRDSPSNWIIRNLCCALDAIRLEFITCRVIRDDCTFRTRDNTTSAALWSNNVESTPNSAFIEPWGRFLMKENNYFCFIFSNFGGMFACGKCFWGEKVVLREINSCCTRNER